MISGKATLQGMALPMVTYQVGVESSLNVNKATGQGEMEIKIRICGIFQVMLVIIEQTL